MPELSDFRLGAAVETSDGRKVGTLVSVLVEEHGFEPKALVVKHEESLVGRLMAAEKLFITDEIVVPIGAVESATHDLVRLSMAEPDLRRQKPYLSHHFLPPTIGQLLLQEASILSGGIAFPSAEEDANKPGDEIEIERGENVMLGETGRKLGHVHEILFDHGEVIGVVIRPEGFFKQDVVLPVRLISRGDDLALFADLKAVDVENLKPYVEPAG
jgi:sporulation protein YlmC with PRC-barrel domain